MGLITSRIGNVSFVNIMGSSLPIDPGKQIGSRKSSVSTWMTWNNKYLSKPLGWNNTSAISLPMSYGGMAVKFEGTNTSAFGLDSLVDMAASMTGSNTMDIASTMTVLWDVASAMVGTNTFSTSAQITIDMACAMVVNTLTQGDVEGATLDAEVEPGVTLREALKVILAYAAGKTTITDLGGGTATVVFRDVNDTADRIEASVVGSERQSIILDTD